MHWWSANQTQTDFVLGPGSSVTESNRHLVAPADQRVAGCKWLFIVAKTANQAKDSRNENDMGGWIQNKHVAPDQRAAKVQVTLYLGTAH